MFKGTTPTHTFNIPIDSSLVKTAKITYTQRDKEVLVKRTEDCTFEGKKIVTKLCQEDTFKFEHNTIVTIQLRVLTNSGDVLASDLIMTSVGKCLDNEVLL